MLCRPDWHRAYCVENRIFDFILNFYILNLMFFPGQPPGAEGGATEHAETPALVVPGRDVHGQSRSGSRDRRWSTPAQQSPVAQHARLDRVEIPELLKNSPWFFKRFIAEKFRRWFWRVDGLLDSIAPKAPRAFGAIESNCPRLSKSSVEFSSFKWILVKLKSWIVIGKSIEIFPWMFYAEIGYDQGILNPNNSFLVLPLPPVFLWFHFICVP